MVDLPQRPLLNPVLRFLKDPAPKPVTGGGKNRASIVNSRLNGQRKRLASQLDSLNEQVSEQPSFGTSIVLHAAMFEDSFAPSYLPSDLFDPSRSASIVAATHSGYLIEVPNTMIDRISRVVSNTDSIRELVDISRIREISFFEAEGLTLQESLDDIWHDAPESEAGRDFIVWLLPLKNNVAADALIETFMKEKEKSYLSLPPILLGAAEGGSDLFSSERTDLRVPDRGRDRITLAVRNYREKRNAKTTVRIPNQDALTSLMASGAIFRIEPVKRIVANAPGEGQEPSPPIAGELEGAPVVGVIDGGLTAASYLPAEAWRAPALISDGDADVSHGNKVVSLVVQGHDWNNNLALPPLYCRVGTVQAVPKTTTQPHTSHEDLIAYLDAVFQHYSSTKVWNLSFNEQTTSNSGLVSSIGHDIRELARKHGILPIISIGNQPGGYLKGPADCEAAITVGGRRQNANGDPDAHCPTCLSGPGPASMLKPDISNFSNVRTIGGTVVTGSSFATALTSPLAAHTMNRLRNATPDMTKTLLIHNTETAVHCAERGFGTPQIITPPWECRPGYVTLQWSASLTPGAAYYWEVPMLSALAKTGALKGHGNLTAILNPGAMVSELGGPNYFSARLETALQFQRGYSSTGAPKFDNLLGGLQIPYMTEEQHRELDHKWSPVRQYAKEFSVRVFEDNPLRIYARVYTRDLYLHGYNAAAEVPPMEANFVLTLGTGDEQDGIYQELRDSLGVFAEPAIIESDIEVDND